jgi:hypothetical protein
MNESPGDALSSMASGDLAGDLVVFLDNRDSPMMRDIYVNWRAE